MENPATQQAVRVIREHFPDPDPPRLLLVLGSGWGPVVGELATDRRELPYPEIPGFPESTVAGHGGVLVRGTIGGAPVWIMQGRFHFYEGYDMERITFPIRVFAALGTNGVLLTNAAGGIDRSF